MHGTYSSVWHLLLLAPLSQGISLPKVSPLPGYILPQGIPAPTDTCLSKVSHSHGISLPMVVIYLPMVVIYLPMVSSCRGYLPPLGISFPRISPSQGIFLSRVFPSTGYLPAQNISPQDKVSRTSVSLSRVSTFAEYLPPYGISLPNSGQGSSNSPSPTYHHPQCIFIPMVSPSPGYLPPREFASSRYLLPRISPSTGDFPPRL